MNTRSFLRWTVAVGLILSGARAASAACVINGARPAVPLPVVAGDETNDKNEKGDGAEYRAGGQCGVSCADHC